VIGGMDTILAVPSGPTALDYCIHLIARWWPDCVFLIDDDPATYTSYLQFASRRVTEVIMHRDPTACQAWDELGYDDSLRGTMVYFISEPERLTLVTEHNPSQAIQDIIKAVSEGLQTAFQTWQDTPPTFLEAA
jgi:hypothetical protein